MGNTVLSTLDPDGTGSSVNLVQATLDRLPKACFLCYQMGIYTPFHGISIKNQGEKVC